MRRALLMLGIVAGGCASPAPPGAEPSPTPAPAPAPAPDPVAAPVEPAPVPVDPVAAAVVPRGAPECGSDADCTIATYPRSCRSPCGGCPHAMTTAAAAALPSGHSMAHMERRCPHALTAHCQDCPPIPSNPRAVCADGSCDLVAGPDGLTP